jgi:hypothetical protein
MGQITYTGSNGQPTPNATSTASDGLAIIFNVPPGTYSADAMASGMSLREHDIKAYAQSVTTTAVVP